VESSGGRWHGWRWERRYAIGSRIAGRAVVAVLFGPLALVIVARLAGLGFALPLEAGVAYTVVLALLALVTLARKG